MDPIEFGQFDLSLTGGSINGGASALQWGPDGLLYVVGRNGFVYAIEVTKNTDPGTGETTGYSGVIQWTHDLNAPNFDDDGASVGGGSRQALGIVVTEDDVTGETVVYVSHSDIKIGAGGGGGSGDVGLDTNSGVVTRIKLDVDGQKNVTENEALDIIRGLPRSEENHATNGLALTTNDDGNPILLIASGGHANAGAPSVNFVGLPEYTYSAAVLSADLNALAVIEAAKKNVDPNIDHVFDMPTLDDPTRTNFTDSGGDVWIDANFDGQVDSVAEFVDQDGDGIPDWMVDQDGDSDVDADDVADFVATKIVDANGDGVRDTILYQDGGSATDNVTGVRGGNDALNQAKLLVGNPVQIYSSGYRNTYDVLVTADGKKYTYDNGANGGWGGVAVNDNGTVTNEPNNLNQTQNFDQLHEFDEGTHSGHPNPTVASGSAAGLWTSPTVDDGNAPLPIDDWRQLSDTPLPAIGQEDDGLVLPADWDEVVDPALINPDAGVYNEGGTVADGALDADKGSWNGLAEYTGTAFGGQLQGAILVTKTNGSNNVKWIKRDVNGDIDVVAKSGGALGSPGTIIEAADQGTVGTTGKGNTLGIDAVGDEGIDGLGLFNNTIWVGSLSGTNKITIFEAGGEPAGADLDKDDDGIDHVADYYEFSAAQGVDHVLDPQGTTTTVNAGETRVYTLSAESYSLSAPGGIGQLGFMVNLAEPSAEGGLLSASDNVIPGGAGSGLQIKDIRSGTAKGTDNDQRDALTFAVSPGSDAGRLEISTSMNAILTGFYQNGSEAGLQIGTGDQFSYMSLVLAYSGTGTLSMVLYYEEDDVQQATQSVDVSSLLETIGSVQRLPDTTVVEFLFDVNTISGVVTPKFRIATDGNLQSAAFTEMTPVQATGDVLDAMQGNFTANGVPHPLAFGNIGTSAIDPAAPAQPVEDDNVNVTYDEFKVTGFAPQVDGFLSITDAAVSEDGGSVVLTVTLEDEFGTPTTLGEDVTVGYTLGGNADTPADATVAPAAPLTIAAGQSTASVTVTINDDTIVEGTETLDVALGTIAANGLAVQAKAGADVGTVTITDNDVPDPGAVLYRVNAGTATDVAGGDGGPDWLGDANLIGPNGTGITVSGNTGDTFSDGLTDAENEMDLTNLVSPVPWQLFVNERGDNNAAAPALDYAFDVTPGVAYTVTLYYVENWQGIFNAANRIFDVSLEGSVPEEFDDIHPLREATDYVDGPGAPLPSGSLTDPEKQPYLGTAFSKSVTYTATDDQLNLSFIHNSQNPKINAIEISVADPGTGGSVAVVSVADVTVNEPDGTATVTFSLSAPVTEGAVTVPFIVTDGSAEAGSDFTAPTVLNVVFDGTQTATATFAITDDAEIEGPETFSVAIDAGAIAAPPDATVTASAGASSVTVTILDNDAPAPSDGAPLYRVNVGGPKIVLGADDATTPGDPDLDWGQDQGTFGDAANSPYLAAHSTGNSLFNSSSGSSYPGDPATDDPSIPAGTPIEIFNTERYDPGSAPEMLWQFPVAADHGLQPGDQVEVRLYFAELFTGVDAAEERVFDVSVDGVVPASFDDIDQFAIAGPNAGFMRSYIATVDAEGVLDLEFIHDVENPALKGIEIVAVDDPQTQDVTIAAQDISADESTGEITITFTLSAPVAAGAITVPFTLVDVTTAVGEDYVAGQDGEVTFPAGDDSDQTVVITLVNDTDVEADESFTVELGTPTAVPAGVNVTTVDGAATILDDDVAVVDNFNGAAAPGDDWSGDNTTPDDVTLVEGPNTLVATGGNGDADFITFEVAEGQQVTSITLANYVGSDAGFLGLQIGDSVPTQADIEGGSATLDGGTVYSGLQVGSDLLPLLSSTVVENAGQATNGLTTPLAAGTYTLWFNQNQGPSETTLEIVSEPVPGADPEDIDGDGIPNTDDPFAYDGSNGDAKVLVAGGEFTQDFETDTTDPFSPEGGFSGILVNPAFDYGNPTDPAADPYGNRTNEAGVSISGGTLNILSTETDAFPTSGTGTNNTLADAYQSAVDVTGLNSFEVHARASSAKWLAATAFNGFAQFGISLGAGGVDDFVKLVLSDAGKNAPRVQLAHNNSLVGGDNNYAVNTATGPTIDLSLIGDVEFRLIVDKTAGTIVGQVDFFAADGGALLESFTTPAATILADSSLVAALNGENPLTGGDGGLAYGVIVSDWNAGDSNRITANYDFLTVRALDEPPADVAPTVALTNVVALAEDADTTAAVKVADIAVTDDGLSPVTLGLAGADAALFEIVGTELFLKAGTALDFETQPSFDVSVVATDAAGSTTSEPLGALVTDANDAPTGTVAITGTASQGETLTASNDLDDADGLGPIAYQWQADGVDIPGATGDTYVLTQADVGAAITVVASYTDGGGTVESVSSAPTAAVTDTPPSDPIRIQAEDFDASSLYATQTQGAADGSEVIFLPSGGATGSATYNLAGKGVVAGTYDLTVGYFDENDGTSFVVVAVDGSEVGSITFDDDATSGNAAQASSFRTATFFGVTVGADGQLVLSGTSDAGEYARIDWIEFTPVDGGGDPDNTAPYAPFGLDDQTVAEGAAFSFDVDPLFADNEEDPRTYTATATTTDGQLVDDLPAGVTFDPATGVFGGAPTAAGSYAITVTANDGALDSDPAVFTLTVEGVNAAPEVDQAIATQTLNQGAAVALDVTENFSDPDGDALTYSVDPGALPPGVTFVDGVFGGAVASDAPPGSYQVTVTVADPSGAEAFETFLFNVLGEVDDRPTVRIEAEDGQLVEGFFVEAGSRIRLLANGEGTATYDLSGIASGEYFVKVGHYDENDGEGTIGVGIASDGQDPFQASFILDDDETSGNAAQAASFRLKTLPGTVTIGANGVLTLTGEADGTTAAEAGPNDVVGDEFVRVDYLELVPVGGGQANFAPDEAGGGIPDTTVEGLAPVSIDASLYFADPEEDALTYTKVEGPDWLSVDPVSGLVTGTPLAGGAYAVVVAAEDATNNPGLLALSQFTLTVDVSGNEVPVPSPLNPAAVSLDEDTPLEEFVSFSDPDGNDAALVYSLGQGAPDWIDIDPASGALTGTPGNADVGMVTLEVIATDPLGASASALIDLTVNNVNDAPALGAPLADQSAVQGQPFSYALPAGAFTDPDLGLPGVAETLTYSATLESGAPLPGWLSIDPATGALSGTPDSGTDLSVVITATDASNVSVSAPPIAIAVTTSVVPADPVVIEAEDFTALAANGGIGEVENFTVNAFPGASGGEVLRAPSTGQLSVIETDISAHAGGSFRVGVTFVDETDGTSTGTVFIDGQEVGAWSFDGTAGVQVNAGAATGSFTEPGNFRYVEFDLPVVIGPESVLRLEVQSQGGEFGRIDSATLIPAEIPAENEAPSAVVVTPLAAFAGGVPEDLDTATRVKVADIAVTDDGLGTNVLSLSDATVFEIDGLELFIKAGAVLDFETAPSLDVTVAVNDAEVGDTVPDAAVAFSLAVTDVPEPPTDPVVSIGNAATLVEAGDAGANTQLDFPVSFDTTPSGDVTVEYTVSINGGAAVASSAVIPAAGGSIQVDVPADDIADGDETVTVTLTGIAAGSAASATLGVVTATGTVTEDDVAVADPTALLRINAWGPQVTAIDGGPNWLGDGNGAPNSSYLTVTQSRGDTQGYSGDGGLIPAAVPEGVLDTARSSDAPFSYAIPLADLANTTDLTIRLYLAELFPGNQAVGDRVFDISVEGNIEGELDNIDPSVPNAGGDLRIVEYDVTVTDGVLNIGFEQEAPADGGSDNPIINAIEILSNPDAAADTTGPAAVITLINPDDANSPLGVEVALSDASGIDQSTLGDDDIQLLVGGSPQAASISFDGFVGGTASYSIAAPSTGWTDGLALTVELLAGAIADASAGANTNPVASQSLTLDIGGGSTGGSGDRELLGDLDGDQILNGADGDIDGDGTPNLDDRAAYNAANAGPALSAGDIVLDFTQFADGTSPFEAGFDGVAQTADGTAELDYATNNGAQVQNGRLTFQTTDPDTNDGQQAFTLLADVEGGNFTFEGVFDNPVFGGTELATFSQYGLIISLTGTPGASTGADGDFFKFVTGNPGNGLEMSGRGSFTGADAKIAYPAGVTATNFAQVVMSVAAQNGALTGTATYLDAQGGTLGVGAIGPISPTAGSAIANVLAGTSSVQPAFGVTSTDFGSGGAFTVGVESLTLAGGGGGDPVDPPVNTDDVIEILEGLTDVDSGASYGGGATGSATLKIMPGNSGIDSSNFGSGSFQLANTGDKQIAAVFLDFRNALYGDSVVDFDGTGGDTQAKEFQINGTNSVGGFFDANNASTYFFPGEVPDEDPNVTGQGVISPVSGGWRGLLIKFDGGSGGFAGGESVGFSGDMDPNSVAGLPKSGDFNILSGAIEGWDVGGVSGAELIGSSFSVLFDDGSIATGYLGSDDSLGGSGGEAVVGRADKTATVTVNATGSNQTGTYGGTEPVIVVSGTPGDLVKVTLTKGFDPVTNPNIDDLVEGRLLDAQPQFPASNAANFQTVNVTIGANGTATVPAGAFDYNTPVGNAAAKSDIPGYATLPIAVSASVVDGADNPLGPVDRVYLASNGQPVDGGGGEPPVEPVDGFFEGIGSGSNFRFKVQIEDPNVDNGGTDPGGKWSFIDAPEDGNQTGFQGDGYFLFGSDTSTAINNVIAGEVLEYTIDVPEGQTGTYTFRFRVSRDGQEAMDQQNDLWLNFKKAGTNESIEDYLTNTGGSEAEPTNQGYIKVFGGPNDGSWGNASNFDGLPGNPATQVAITEPGLYTVQIAGRSQGFHVDFWELYKGSAPSLGASDSDFVATGPREPTVANPIADQQIEEGDGYSFTIPAGTFQDLDGDTLSLAISAPAGFSVNGTTVTAPSSLAQGDYTITVTATDDDQNSVSDSFVVSVVEEIVVADFQAVVESAADDIELGSPVTSSDLETDKVVQLRFTIADGVSDVSNVTSALLSWESDRTHSGDATLTFQVEDSLDAEAFGTGKSFIGGQETVQITGAWQDAALIGDVVDIADQLNALIASQGPLNAGDTINLQVTGSGATRYISQATAVLDISADGSGGGSTGGGSTGGGSTGGGSTGGGTGPGTTMASIDSSSDDWEQFGGAGSSDLEFGANGTTPQFVGMRFDGLEIPDSAEITAAYFEFEAFEASSGPAEYLIEIENSTSAVTFSPDNNPGDRSYAGITVDWAPGTWTAGQTVQSADLSDLIEAVLGGGGLDTADALVFQITGSGARAAHAFDSTGGAAPKLVIDYDDLG